MARDEARERLVEVVGRGFELSDLGEVSEEGWKLYEEEAADTVDALSAHLSEHPEDAEGLGARRVVVEFPEDVYFDGEAITPDDDRAEPGDLFAWPKDPR